MHLHCRLLQPRRDAAFRNCLLLSLMLTAPLAAKARPTRECDRDDLSAAGSRREGPGEQVPNDDDATSTFPALLSHARRGLGVGATVGRHAPPLPRMTQTAIYITLTCVPLKFSARPVPISTRGRRHLHWSGLLARSELGPRSKKKKEKKRKEKKARYAAGLLEDVSCSHWSQAGSAASVPASPANEDDPAWKPRCPSRLRCTF